MQAILFVISDGELNLECLFVRNYGIYMLVFTKIWSLIFTQEILHFTNAEIRTYGKCKYGKCKYSAEAFLFLPLPLNLYDMVYKWIYKFSEWRLSFFYNVHLRRNFHVVLQGKAT